MAIRIFVGSSIVVHGIPWVVTNAALIRFAPIVPVSNMTLASFPLMNMVSSSTWCALIVAGRAVLVLAVA